MTGPWFEPNFFDEEADELVMADECKCAECGETFHLPPDGEIDECPNCGIVFDNQ